MEKNQLILFFFFAALVCLVIVSGLVVFIIQYRKRKMEYTAEMALINKSHEDELLMSQLDIQVQTMQDIGREIHDNVGQKLTLASIYTSRMIDHFENDGSKDKIIAIGQLINESLHELRSLSKSITNEKINSTELIAILDQECERVNTLQNCSVHFSKPKALFTMSAIQKNFIHRIVQEFFQNSLKHASCTDIHLKINFESSILDLTLADNGIGFNTNRISGGIGLDNMRSRARLLNAAFLLDSKIGNGVTLNIKLPLTT